MTELLVSVRDSREASSVVHAGVGLIDIKDPLQGSLGRAEDLIVASILDTVADRCPVSMAMGELGAWNGDIPIHLPRLRYLKWGLAGADPSWADRLQQARQQVESHTPCRVVYTSYVDWRRAGAPSPAEVCHQAIHDRAQVVLFDTFHKDGTTLLNWLSCSELEQLVTNLRSAGARVALAGRLDRQQITRLLSIRPDWVAVRGSVCMQRDRQATIDEHRVRELVSLIRESNESSQHVRPIEHAE